MKRLALTSFLLAGMLAVALQGTDTTAQATENQAAHHADMQKQMNSMNKMMVEHLGKGDKDYEKRFIDMMIPHHEGAVMMAEHALKNTKQPDLKKMAQKMIDDQTKEIEQLKKWRSEWYGDKNKEAAAK